MSSAEGISLEADTRSTGRWSDFGSWAGDGLRREVFFFPSRGIELYGSLYAAAEPSRPFGVVCCSSWGVEADRTDPLVRSVALTMARIGGAGMVFHYPGYGDSFGRLADLDLSHLSDAASDAVGEASRRCPGLTWIFAGFMLGASVACLAQRRTAAEMVVLVQPALRPGAYFRWLAGRTQQLAPGPTPREMMEPGPTPGMVYGYPLPRPIIDRADDADSAVDAALTDFCGKGVVIRHVKPQDVDPMPAGFERVDIPGAWRFGSQSHPRLARASAEWLDRHTRDGRR